MFAYRFSIAATGTIVSAHIIRTQQSEYIKNKSKSKNILREYITDATSSTRDLLGLDESGSWNHLTTQYGMYADDQFAQSLDISADGLVIAIGLPQSLRSETPTSTSVGLVQVYSYDPILSDWEQLGSDIWGQQSDAKKFGFSLSLSDDGSILAVGDRYNNINGYRTGMVEVFRYDSLSRDWSLLGQRLTSSTSNEHFGFHVALDSSGYIVACGVQRSNEDAGDNKGKVQVFGYNSSLSLWVQVGNDIEGDSLSFRFGSRVRLSSDGSRAAIASWYNELAEDAGQVYVFEYDGSSLWIQLGSTFYDEVKGVNVVGRALDISGDGTIVAIDDTQRVKVYTYSELDKKWSEMGNEISTTNNWNDNGFGNSVALSYDGYVLAVGRKDSGGTVEIYSYNNNDWVMVGTSFNSGTTNYGTSVSLSSNGETLVIGSPNEMNESNNTNAGSFIAYKYQITTFQPSTSGNSSDQPSISHVPTSYPSYKPSDKPSFDPSPQLTSPASLKPSQNLSIRPSSFPSNISNMTPSSRPSMISTDVPSDYPTRNPSDEPSDHPSEQPSMIPTNIPSDVLTNGPSAKPSYIPSDSQSGNLTNGQSAKPFYIPSDSQTRNSSLIPSSSHLPSDQPSMIPTDAPKDFPTNVPSDALTNVPSDIKSDYPSSSLTSNLPSAYSSNQPTMKRTIVLSGYTSTESRAPSDHLSVMPSYTPSLQLSMYSSDVPTNVSPHVQTVSPSMIPSSLSNILPHVYSSDKPSINASSTTSSLRSSLKTSVYPSGLLSIIPTNLPSGYPSSNLSEAPSNAPSFVIIRSDPPSEKPNGGPSQYPSYDMSRSSNDPTIAFSIFSTSVNSEQNSTTTGNKKDEVILRFSMLLLQNITSVMDSQTVSQFEEYMLLYMGIQMNSDTIFLESVEVVEQFIVTSGRRLQELRTSLSIIMDAHVSVPPGSASRINTQSLVENAVTEDLIIELAKKIPAYFEKNSTLTIESIVVLSVPTLSPTRAPSTNPSLSFTPSSIETMIQNTVLAAISAAGASAAAASSAASAASSSASSSSSAAASSSTAGGNQNLHKHTTVERGTKQSYNKKPIFKKGNRTVPQTKMKPTENKSISGDKHDLNKDNDNNMSPKDKERADINDSFKEKLLNSEEDVEKRQGAGEEVVEEEEEEEEEDVEAEIEYEEEDEEEDAYEKEDESITSSSQSLRKILNTIIFALKLNHQYKEGVSIIG